jgi:hypothetical protein
MWRRHSQLAGGPLAEEGRKMDASSITINAFLFVLLVAVSIRMAMRDDRARLDRLERKLNLIIQHLGIEPPDNLSERVKELARDPSKKIQAIKVQREETGAGLKEAKDAVEDWIAAQRT